MDDKLKRRIVMGNHKVELLSLVRMAKSLNQATVETITVAIGFEAFDLEVDPSGDVGPDGRFQRLQRVELVAEREAIQDQDGFFGCIAAGAAGRRRGEPDCRSRIDLK